MPSSSEQEANLSAAGSYGAGTRATNDGEKPLHLKSFEGSGRNLVLSGSPEADTEESAHGAVEDDYSDESGA